MSYEIRKATESDIDQLVVLFNEATKRKIDKGDTAWGDPNWVEAEVDSLLSKGTVFIAKKDGDIAGTVSVSMKDERGAWDSEPSVYIQKLAGRETDKGIGRIMLDSARVFAESHEMHRLRLDCSSGNHRLCDYYERAGFTKVKTVPTEEDGEIALFEKQV